MKKYEFSLHKTLIAPESNVYTAKTSNPRRTFAVSKTFFEKNCDAFFPFPVVMSEGQ
ncbi:MAG: hypothetical protein IJL32_03170 [Oscillospiraceae bacterium]|nr:hypothetical protein [Oscillospiraceae bacterium]